MYKLSLLPSDIMNGQNRFSLITYMFIHLNLMHLVTNMFVLMSVGTVLERRVGSLRFALVYLFSGIIGGLLHSSVDPSSISPVIGASGAVFGLIAMLLLLMPFMITTALVIPLPGVVVGIGMLVVEVMSLLLNQDVSVAHDIHLYGFLVGGVSAFVIDYNKALRGLIIAVVALLALYMWVSYGGQFSVNL
ncbi:MAG: rhomboid family intramembrane serine protease [Candidatus Bathyarchaeota archaeon]|nr:rhomboid family intramembrane serine protease [Candidatus Bathyarchaeota archaeon]